MKDGDKFVMKCSPVRERLEPVCDRILSVCETDLSGCLTPQRCHVARESDENRNTANIAVDLLNRVEHEKVCAEICIYSRLFNWYTIRLSVFNT